MDILKDLPTNVIPAELWKAFTLILLSVLILIVKKYLTHLKANNDEIREERKEFREQLLKLTINDAVQDERLDNIEHNGRIVKYRKS